MSQAIYSVKQVNQYIKGKLEADSLLSEVWIRGEISNYTLHRSGHMYFSIKDEGSILKSVMFAGNTKSLRFIPKNGMKVIIRGSISVYEPSGQYQIITREMQPDGIGDLHLAFEQLKQKLEQEGLFSEEFKKVIPPVPKHIGIITSPTGAAVHDMITTIKRRYPIANIVLIPVLVQGDGAPASIIEAIRMMNDYGKVDTLIVGRGGGSIEDLWAFNDEGVARAIFASSIPVLSAVGHETDFTIADFVADMRAPTPTAAAEMATPYTLQELKQSVTYYENKFKRELLNTFSRNEEKLKRIQQSLNYFHPKKVHETNVQKHDLLHENLVKTMERLLQNKRKDYVMTITKLDGLSPLKIMSRGYSAVYKEEELIKSVGQVDEKEKVVIHVSDGKLHCTVDHITKTKEE